jgi:predicted metalloprotease with PDZ domain
MLRRAGLMTEEEFLDAYRIAITAYENNTGHLFQSATQSSRDTWTPGAVAAGSSYLAPAPGQTSRGVPGGGSEIRKTISYYDKGNALGLLLDFTIRHETKNQNSLDTVMRTLYREYYQKKNRGWTDDEFRSVCEKVAGVPLPEIFQYASTTNDIDYAKYLAYAGLELEKPKELPEARLGAIAENKDGRLIITAVEGDSPAQQAGLAPGDQIKVFNGAAVDAKAFNEALVSKKPENRFKLTVSRDNMDREIEVVLGHKIERSFKILPVANPDPLAAAIRKDWMGAK